MTAQRAYSKFREKRFAPAVWATCALLLAALATAPVSAWGQDLTVNGNITLTSGDGQTITTPGTSLTLTQTGDALGPTSLSLQDRYGSAGALF